VEEAQPVSRLRGRAEIGAGTVGEVHWQIEPRRGGSRVTLSARVVRARPLDRVLLLLGGRWWLGRVFAEAVEQLGRVA
jgi:hypothetical protein